MKNLLQENKPAILFIVKFVGLYLILNILYGFFIESYHPQADPITIRVTRQVASIASLFHASVQAVPDSSSEYVSLLKDSQTIVNVFEGCNSINVMIVYLAFLIAFKGSLRSTVVFSLGGLIIIYIMNLIRVLALFEIAYYFPEQLYFFHKYLFTAIIYLVVFVIWYYWIKRTLREKQVV